MARADFVVPPHGPADAAMPSGDDATPSRPRPMSRTFDQALGDLVRLRALGYALTTVVLLGLNRIFLEQSNELLSDVPFLLGLMLSLYGYERLRRAAGTRQWAVATATATAGLALAALTRPTFWILAVAWVAACV